MFAKRIRAVAYPQPKTPEAKLEHLQPPRTRHANPLVAQRHTEDLIQLGR
jgi:hypothetical protein